MPFICGRALGTGMEEAGQIWDSPGEGAVEKGYAAELTVSDAIVAQSGGRLKVARPRPDDHGVDRLIFRTQAGLALSLQVKAAYALGKDGVVEFAFDKADVPATSESYFGLCVAPLKGALRQPDRFWLVPAKEILRGGRGRKNKLRVPYAAKRKGRWTPYVHPFGDLAGVLEAKMDEAEAARRKRGRGR